MKHILLFYLLLPLTCLAQYPLQTENWDFQVKQRKKMQKLGYNRAKVYHTVKYTPTGKILESERTWQAFDAKGRFVKRGFTNRGRDTTEIDFFYSPTGKYLGETEYAKRTRYKGHGRKFYYDANDSLVDIRWMPSNEFYSKYSYTAVNDSTVLFMTYDKDSQVISTQTIVHTGNRIITWGEDNGKRIMQKEQTVDEAGREILSVDYINGGEMRHTYKPNGQLLRWEQIGGDGKSLWHRVYTYDSQHNLVKAEWFADGRPKERMTYTYSGKLLVRQNCTKYYAGVPDEEVPIHYTYYPNGLMKTASCSFQSPTAVTHTFSYTYD